MIVTRLCQREAGETGCFGLVPGSARQLYTQEWFSASECEKGDGPFYVRRAHDYFPHSQTARLNLNRDWNTVYPSAHVFAFPGSQAYRFCGWFP